MAKVLCVLYDDPVGGYPKSYPRDDIPKITRYPDGQSTPTPENIDFRPGTLLGSVSGALGLRPYLEQQGHEFVVTSDKDGPDSLFERELTPATMALLATPPLPPTRRPLPLHRATRTSTACPE
jgi:formate dehydrogenase